jgi:hypothetical protein
LTLFRRALVVLLAAVGAITTAQTVDTSVNGVLAAADAYLLRYQKQLTFLLADEQTTQEAINWRGETSARRRTSGDLFVAFVPADREWVAVHDIAHVDGQPTEGHEDVRRLLERDTVAGVARQLVERNARFNIGAVRRNFNEPTLGLLVLEPRRRSHFKFERTRVDRSGDTTVVTLAFRETERPTLIQSEGRAVYSTGEVSIEAGTGRIRRTFVELKIQGIVNARSTATTHSTSAQLTTVYERDPKLDLWLPATFTERYEQEARNPRRATIRDIVKCVSIYTNWRRFAAISNFRPL